MSDIYENWDKEHFKTFLMIHLANADLKVSEDELVMIMEQVSSEKYRHVKKQWDKCNDYECIQLIRKLKERFYPGQEGKEELIVSMTAFAGVDENFSTNEKIMISAMNKLL